MDPLILSQEVGVLAGIFFVVAYGLLNFGVLATSSPLYQALNVLGVLGFVYTAVSPFNPGLLITDGVWALAALGFCGGFSLEGKRLSTSWSIPRTTRRTAQHPAGPPLRPEGEGITQDSGPGRSGCFTIAAPNQRCQVEKNYNCLFLRDCVPAEPVGVVLHHGSSN
ncbi:putative membrane protein [Corynebacterium deserti GIMN1.010]|uniref:Putative membrane protein n=1 Tax=Corynebacterium deserti GIMN1.010 TaxID=931089 RepID=A0A0M4CJM7_9CORY|nr:putative membrane protein [Corynebacterium deserti GIMN1.010]